MGSISHTILSEKYTKTEMQKIKIKCLPFLSINTECLKALMLSAQMVSSQWKNENSAWRKLIMYKTIEYFMTTYIYR